MLRSRKIAASDALLAVAASGELEPALGPQASSVKPGSPSWSMPRGQRDPKRPVERGSTPGPGEYYPKRQLSAPSVGFGTGERSVRKALVPRSKSGDYTTADLLAASPNWSAAKASPGCMMMDKASRFQFVNSPEFEGFPQGIDSPGPKYAPTGGRSSAPSYSMGVTLQAGGEAPGPQSPPKVGPGRYGALDSAIGAQCRSDRPSAQAFSISNAKRWKEKKTLESGVKRPLTRPASAPTCRFGTASRSCTVNQPLMPEDMGPSRTMSSFRPGCPELPLRSETVKYGSGLVDCCA